MFLSEFDFELPSSLIAEFPATPRDHSKLLVYDRNTKQIQHTQFYELSRYLLPNDLLILNNTKVIPARLKVRDEKDTRFEVFLIKKIEECLWECLVKPGKKIRQEKTKIFFKDDSVGHIENFDGFKVRFESKENFFDWLSQVGGMPLPPYIKRELTPEDMERYQTIYAEKAGSVASPTAGLHFTERVFDSLKEKGISIEFINLNVGYGTFAPIRVDDLSQHQMHHESYEISERVSNLINKKEKRVIAVGTTTLRALESIDKYGLIGNTDIFIQPGYQFKKIDGLITNFHLPQSSLFILFCALVGKDEAKRIYKEAIQCSYRFFSYGDAMLVL